MHGMITHRQKIMTMHKPHNIMRHGDKDQNLSLRMKTSLTAYREEEGLDSLQGGGGSSPSGDHLTHVAARLIRKMTKVGFQSPLPFKLHTYALRS